MRICFLISVLILCAAPAFRAVADDSHKHPAATPAKPAAAATALTDGEVRVVDKAAGKITIKHGAIPRLDMPPMTMAYLAKDKSMLDQLKPGDKIRFEAVVAGNEFTLTRLEQVK
jgi:Cu(I)/Ag(I) efflux system protein CusF